MKVLRTVGKGTVRVFLVAFLIYVIVSASYGASWSHVEDSIMYNSSERETKAFLVYIPIISLISAVLLGIFFPYVYREVFMSWNIRAERRMRRVGLEVDREMRERGR